MGTPRYRLRNDRGALPPIHLKVRIVLYLAGSVFSVGVFHKKRVKLDLPSNPRVLGDGNDAFSISMGVPLTFVLHILLDVQAELHHTSHTAVDTNTWDHRMHPCCPCALKQPAAEDANRMYDIDMSGAGTPSAIGYKPDDSRTYEAM